MKELDTLQNSPLIGQTIRIALQEDDFKNDRTIQACQISDFQTVRATILAKSETVACGGFLIQKILDEAGFSSSVRKSLLKDDGQVLQPKTPWFFLEGPASQILTIERTILNFLIRMCGIAHQTKKVVESISHTQTKLLHTRKTMPGLRSLDIYACLTGGAHLHRTSLSDAILVKENHLTASPNFQTIGDGMKELRPLVRFTEIEVKDFVELKYAVGIKPDRILLDNFTPENISKAVNLFGGSIPLEASGNITPENAKTYAETGVDYISMGSLTHSVTAADLSMLFDFK